MKFRKLAVPVVAAALAFALSGCGADSPAEVAAANVPASPVNTEASEAASCCDGDSANDGVQDAVATENTPLAPTLGSFPGFVLNLRDAVINLNQDMEEVIAVIGEPLNVHQSPSCAFEGYDRIFQFPGLQIHTYPMGDRDFVHIISFMDDSITTENGIFLGASWDDVVAAYGEIYVQEFSKFTFTRGNTTLSFFLDGDMVTAINYELILDV